jgi:two-component system C4-dicarboxylate transport response regulator DctD
MAYSWPGNVRELKNIAERYVLGINGPNRSVSSLLHPPDAQHSNLADQVEAFEKNLIEQSLLDNKGNIQATMEDLRTPRRTLNEKVRKHGLERKKYF